VFSEAAEAARMQAYLATSKRCRGFQHARLFGAFLDEKSANAVGMSSVDRIPGVPSDPDKGLLAARLATELTGATLVAGFLSEDDEIALLEELDRDDLWDTGPQATQASRRTQHFGYDYNYAMQGADAGAPARPLPPLVARIAERVRAAVSPETLPFGQVTLQEYIPGDGIPPHIDTVWAFGDVLASVSLLSGCVMRFRPVFGVVTDPEAFSDLWMPPRSLLLLTGSARYHHTHSIPARKHDLVDGIAVQRGRRLSLTLRHMTGCAPPE
jgi:alkylated DNA repair protein alkB family protein 8